MAATTTPGRTATGAKVTILLVDDHPIVRRGIADLINAENDLSICGEAGTMQDAIGAVMRKPPFVPSAGWQYYIRVAGIDAAAEKVKAGGGQVFNGPMEVPGGDWVINGIDPQGAAFSLVGPK